jgi:hypothetical protein
MNLTNSATGQTVRFRADNVVYGPDGCLVVEALFSGVVDLSAPSANLAARIHPAKARAFSWIVNQTCVAVATGDAEAGEGALRLIPEVELHLNRPSGGIAVRRFSELLPQAEGLIETGACKDVKATLTVPGFDPTAEPVLRELRDGSLWLIFNCLPPLASDDPARAASFDMDGFGGQLGEAAGVPLLWDDREVFVIQRPRRATAGKLRSFLLNYWGSE